MCDWRLLSRPCVKVLVNGGWRWPLLRKCVPHVHMTQVHANTCTCKLRELHIQSSMRLHVRMTTRPYGAERPSSTTSCEQMREQLSAGTPVCLRCVVQICVSEVVEFSNRKLQLRHNTWSICTCMLVCGHYTSAIVEIAKVLFVVTLKLIEISLFALIFFWFIPPPLYLDSIFFVPEWELRHRDRLKRSPTVVKKGPFPTLKYRQTNSKAAICLLTGGA